MDGEGAEALSIGVASGGRWGALPPSQKKCFNFDHTFYLTFLIFYKLAPSQICHTTPMALSPHEDVIGNKVHFILPRSAQH